MSVTAEVLRERFDYDPETGVFTRRKQTPGRANTAGHLMGNGYLHFGIGRKKYLAHRLAWLYTHGAWPSGDVDHINGDRTDNRIANLRDVSRAINLQNQRAASSRNKSTGLLGAYRHTQCDGFTAVITVNGKSKYLGMFRSQEEAHAAYIAAKRIYHEGNTL